MLFGTFNPTDPEHVDLVAIVVEVEKLAAQVDVSGATTFQKARKLIRGAVNRAGISERIEKLVNRILPEVE